MNNINIFNFFKFKDSVSAISWDSLIIRFGEPFKLYLLNLDLSIKQQVDLDDVKPRGVSANDTFIYVLCENKLAFYTKDHLEFVKSVDLAKTSTDPFYINSREIEKFSARNGMIYWSDCNVNILKEETGELVKSIEGLSLQILSLIQKIIWCFFIEMEII